MSPLKKGQRLTNNPKNISLNLRLTKSQAEDLQYCADKLKTSRTDIINRGIKEVKMKLLEEHVREFINSFDGKYTLIDFGFSGNDYLTNGFWLKLRANFTPTINSFSMGKIHFFINGNEVYVDGGYLDEIGRGLMVIG